MAPWGAAVTDALEAIAGPEVIDEVFDRDLLEVLPLTHIRGRSLTDSFVIIDEAQNLERAVLLTALSRVGAGQPGGAHPRRGPARQPAGGPPRRRRVGDRDAQGPPAVRPRDAHPGRAQPGRRPGHPGPRRRPAHLSSLTPVGGVRAPTVAGASPTLPGMIDVPDGHLYLGEQIDGTRRERDGEAVLLDASDLTTHGVIVGMTGSGKTGLGVVMLEEALLQGIPTLILDPKGDLGNLLLTFPELRPDDFAPWVEDGEPAQVAEQWRDGLAGWDIDPSRIAGPARRRRVHDLHARLDLRRARSTSSAACAGRPRASTPRPSATRSRGSCPACSAMVGVDSDPLSGREHILLANLIENAWAAGHDLDLPGLVAQVQDPPLRKLGVYELDAFFPAKDRTELAMTLNGLLASRAVRRLGRGTRPRHRPAARLGRRAEARRAPIVSLSHLSDEERQFVVSLLLGKLITWMRRQPGTSKLRVLVYFDEVMGFVPPNGAPPAKKPILTLFKQARAFGVGIVLATQNPVDVDYKGLSNAGTWMIGRLQTEQDKARLLDGLSSAGGEVDVGAVGDTIASLGKREFVLREPGSDAPVLFTTRWALSYLRGPLTRDQIATLMADRKAVLVAAAGQPAPGDRPRAPARGCIRSRARRRRPSRPATRPRPCRSRPTVAEGVAVRWLDPAAPWAAQVGAVPTSTKLAPALVARVALLFDDDKLDLRATEEWEAVYLPAGGATFDPATAIAVDHDDRDLRTEAPTGATYVLSDVPLEKKTWFSGAERAIVDHLFRSRTDPGPPQRRPEAGVTGGRDRRRRSPPAAGPRPTTPPTRTRWRCRRSSRPASPGPATSTRPPSTGWPRPRRPRAPARPRPSSAGPGRCSARCSAAGAAPGRMARDMGAVLGGQGRSAEAARRVDTARTRRSASRTRWPTLEHDLATELAEIDARADAKAAAVETVEVGLEKSDIRVTALALVWVPVA